MSNLPEQYVVVEVFLFYHWLRQEMSTLEESERRTEEYNFVKRLHVIETLFIFIINFFEEKCQRSCAAISVSTALCWLQKSHDFQLRKKSFMIKSEQDRASHYSTIKSLDIFFDWMHVDSMYLLSEQWWAVNVKTSVIFLQSWWLKIALLSKASSSSFRQAAYCMLSFMMQHWSHKQDASSKSCRSNSQDLHVIKRALFRQLSFYEIIWRTRLAQILTRENSSKLHDLISNLVIHHCFFHLHRACLLKTMFSLLYYIMFWKLSFFYISCMQYFNWINDAHLNWSLLVRNITRDDSESQLDWFFSSTDLCAFRDTSKESVMMQSLSQVSFFLFIWL